MHNDLGFDEDSIIVNVPKTKSNRWFYQRDNCGTDSKIESVQLSFNQSRVVWPTHGYPSHRQTNHSKWLPAGCLWVTSSLRESRAPQSEHEWWFAIRRRLSRFFRQPATVLATWRSAERNVKGANRHSYQSSIHAELSSIAVSHSLSALAEHRATNITHTFEFAAQTVDACKWGSFGPPNVY